MGEFCNALGYTGRARISQSAKERGAQCHLPLIVIIAVVVLVAIWFIAIYNGIVTADNKCENAWQTIDAQLQRRNDLIPNLVETVKGYAAHEVRHP